MDMYLSYMSSGFVGPTAELHGPPHLSSKTWDVAPHPTKGISIPLDSAYVGVDPHQPRHKN